MESRAADTPAALSASMEVCGRKPRADTGGASPASNQVDNTEWALRCKLAAAYRIAAHMGWDELIYTHITAKVPGSEELLGGPHILINPYGLTFDEVTASSLLKVTMSGDVVDQGMMVGQLCREGFAFHAAIHQARPDANCVWHSRHRDCAAVSMLSQGLLPLSQEALHFMGANLAYHPFEGVVLDMGERDRLAKSLGAKSKAMLLQNNGPLVLGQTIEEAFNWMFNLTRACSYQVKALAMVGGDTSKLTVPCPTQLETMMDRLRLSSGTGKADEVAENKTTLLAFSAAKRTVERMHGASAIYS